MAFERFSDRSRRVMAWANKDAHGRGSDRIDTEHMLIGLLADPHGVGYNVLLKMGASPDALRAGVDQRAPVVHTGLASPVKLPQTPASKQVVEYAIEEARALACDYVGTEHLVLGLLRAEGHARAVLTGSGITLEAARSVVREFIDAFPRPPQEPTLFTRVLRLFGVGKTSA